MIVSKAAHLTLTAASGVFLSILVLAFALSLSYVGAQSCCSPPLLDPAAARFAQGAHVIVYVDMTTGFTFEEFLNIKFGIEDWNGQPNSAGVTFEVRYAENPTVGVENSIVATYNNEPGSGDGGARINMHRDGTKIWGELKFNIRIRWGAPNFLMASLRSTSRHEMGHGMGLQNAETICPEGSTIMYPSANYETLITSCDNTMISSQTSIYPPTPTPTPTPEPTPTPCARQGESCYWDSDCCAGCVCGEVTGTCFPCEVDGNYAQGGCMSEACSICYNVMEGTYCDPWTSSCWTPILVDVNGDGFHMTDVAGGVEFDGFGHGKRIHTAWTREGSDDAWLVLDRNGNNTIDDGTELFSSASPQPTLPPPDLRHGFNALVQYDKRENGGNGDSVLDKNDWVFGFLRLWQDLNHNGISEKSELHSLSELRLSSIGMDYKLSKRKDQHGNAFRYRARITDAFGAQLGRWAYDVYPVAHP